MKNKAISLFTISLFVSAMAIALYFVLQGNFFLQRAQTVQGSASVTLLPQSGSFRQGENVVIDLVAAINSAGVDGVQVVLNLGGTIPQGVGFKPSTVEGLNLVKSNFSQRRLELAFITTDPRLPLSGNGSAVKLGIISFVAPPNGSLNLSFDSGLTKIIESTNNQNIVSGLQNYTYQFTNQSLLIGDFDQDGDLDITDIALMLSVYTQLSVPVNDTNRQFDVDGSGTIDIADIALVLSKYTSLVVYP